MAVGRGSQAGAALDGQLDRSPMKGPICLLIVSIGCCGGWRVYDYDLTVIGSGASGLLAAGTSASLGFKTLLVEKTGAGTGTEPEFYVGGDCTNAACVPSKAVRSIASIAAAKSSEIQYDGMRIARQQSSYAVDEVRAREDVARLANDVPSLDLEFVQGCHFESDGRLNILCYDNSTWLREDTSSTEGGLPVQERTISSKRFIIATGAGPKVPDDLRRAAEQSGVPYHTYRSILRPGGGHHRSSNSRLDAASLLGPHDDIVMIGGGATACELGQSLCRLARTTNTTVSIVAPELLPDEDAALRDAACALLKNDGCKLHLGVRATNLTEGEQDGVRHLILSDNTRIKADCVVFCTGRSPESSLASLKLQNIGVEWTERGIKVDSCLKTTARHVYAAGDCAAVHPRDRRAAHAGWTGFKAVGNAMLPWFLRAPATHPFVPRVIYTVPELAAAGMTANECVREYGEDGYDVFSVREKGTDRADMDSKERFTEANFIELRAEKISGRILGASACGPAAAETINEVCLSLVNKLTVRDVARTLHSYPSHGYLLHRCATALATKDVAGLLSSCGGVGEFLGRLLRMFNKVKQYLRRSARSKRD